jgi:hypothetical protein
MHMGFTAARSSSPNEEGLIGHAAAWPINPVELNRWVEGDALGDSMSGRGRRAMAAESLRESRPREQPHAT